MTLQTKGFGWSIGIHGVIVLVAVMLHFSAVSPTRMVVIDFTFGDNSTSPAAVPAPQRQGMERRSKVARLKEQLVRKIIEQKVPNPELQSQPEVSLSGTETSTPALRTVPDADPTSSVTDFSLMAETAHAQPGAGSAGSGDASGGADTAHAQPGASSAGSGDASGVVEPSQTTYLKEHFAYIRDRITRSISYPPVARRMGWEGRVKIAFVIREDGGVTDVRVIDSCGFSVLDRNTVDTVMNVVPFPCPPARAEIRMTINYRLE